MGHLSAVQKMLEPLVELERATTWVAQHEDRFLSIDYHPSDGWEIAIFADDKTANRLKVPYPHSIHGSGPTLADAIKDALSKAGE